MRKALRARTAFASLALLSVLDAPPAPAADGGITLQTATTHPMKYHLSLPQGWTEGARWPVLVVVPDAAREFETNLAAFVKARGALPYILVAPHVVTSGGANYRLAGSYRYSDADWKKVADSGDWRFDEDGIAAVLSDVATRYGGEERVFLTGWEAGGHTVWAYTFRHAERLNAAAIVSPNWRGRWMADGAWSTAPSRASLPVEILFCDRSKVEHPEGWDAWVGQSKEAMDVAAAHGFRKVALVNLPGRPHGPLAADVVAFFESVRRKPN